MSEIKTKRPELDQYFIEVAKATATRSTCRHRWQGVVIVKENRIIATGYNGSPPGVLHCIDLSYCPKEEGSYCRAEGLHGESNAIASAAKLGISVDGATMYSIYSPCRACCNLLKSAGIAVVKYLGPYDSFPESYSYLAQLGIEAWDLTAGWRVV